ncbi:zinc finger protein 25 [Syngnathus scovelli]|uniref:zinc finger protein 25 n=1 Tax=Syngnathus scovelli TaxID=161590 RepID=UPI00210F36B7|nr:histone-lysine N-methyltransferase PRDM9 [Syngnathus scovelli]
MCKVRILRTLVKQRLNVAVEEIFELFERTIAQYEEELCRTKEEKEQQRRLLDAILKPQIRLHKADTQLVLQESQEEIAGFDQKEPGEPTHIKEEEQNVWSSQDVEQLQRLEEEDAAASQFAWLSVHVKSEDERDHYSQFCSTQSEEDREADGNAHLLDNNLTTLSDTPNVISPLSDTDHNNHAKEPSAHKGAEKHFICLECGRTFSSKKTLKVHMIIHTGEKRFACSFCAKRFYRKCDLKNHLATHTDEKPYSCAICARGFTLRKYMMLHMKTHAAVPLTRQGVRAEGHASRHKLTHGSLCLKHFSREDNLKLHISKQDDEKLFGCRLCDKRFTYKKNVRIHTRSHTGEKVFACNVCAQRFSYKYQLDKHQCVVMDAMAIAARSEATGNP